jgi:ubiquinone/menaquinone biosynthesis C-methylase UbiE
MPVSNINNTFISVLACPVCSSPLRQNRATLFCKKNHVFPITNGIPIFRNISYEKHAAQQKDYFEKFYTQYERLPRLNWHESYWRLFTKNISLKPKKVFVDLATGTGWLAIRAAKAGCTVIATELTYPIARRAQEFAQKEGVKNILFLVADATQMPFRDKSVSYLTAIALLEHLPNDIVAIKECGRAMEKGGIVWIVTPNQLSEQSLLFRAILFFYDKMLGHVRHYGKTQLSKKFEHAGFVPLNAFYVGHLVKFVQLFVQTIARNDRLWWYFDRIDQRQIAKPNSINLVMGFKKK